MERETPREQRLGLFQGTTQQTSLCTVENLWPLVDCLRLLFLQCNTVNFSRRRFCMTCDCTRGGDVLSAVYIQLC